MTIRPAWSKTDLNLYTAFTFSLTLNVFNLKFRVLGRVYLIRIPTERFVLQILKRFLGYRLRNLDLKVCWYNSSLSRVRLTVCAVRNQEWRRGHAMKVCMWYCWWTKSCTTKDDDYPIIYRVFTIPGGAGFRTPTVYYTTLLHSTTIYTIYYIYIFIHENRICKYTPGSKRLAQLPKGVTVRAYDTPITWVVTLTLG